MAPVIDRREKAKDDPIGAGSTISQRPLQKMRCE
tara:strand:+ start:91 stop:192 length:102 start_codon:yes stop_codon:yes gene_type:complete